MWSRMAEVRILLRSEVLISRWRVLSISRARSKSFVTFSPVFEEVRRAGA